MTQVTCLLLERGPRDWAHEPSRGSAQLLRGAFSRKAWVGDAGIIDANAPIVTSQLLLLTVLLLLPPGGTPAV